MSDESAASDEPEEQAEAEAAEAEAAGDLELTGEDADSVKGGWWRDGW